MNDLPQHKMTLQNVRVPIALIAQPDRFEGILDGDCLRGDLVIRNGRAVSLRPVERPGGTPRLVMPRLTEAHVHLDKCHTVDRLGAVGGDLQAAIEAQRQDKDNWTEEDLRIRAGRGLNELVASGCRSVRSHVDWPHGAQAMTPPPAWHVLSELAEDYRDDVTLQLSPLLGVEDLAEPQIADAVARLVAETGGAFGCFVLGQPRRLEGIENAFRAAEKYAVALDFHVDEGLDPDLDGLAMIAEMAIKTGFEGPVLCGHASALMNQSGAELDRLLERIAQSGLTVASLPATNLYLQGRTEGMPDRRGLTRIPELLSAGVPVVIGTDNVRDAFCPIGRHDPIASLAMAVLAAHLDPPLGGILPMITTHAESALGLRPTYVDQAAAGELLIFNAPSTTELLAGTTRPTTVAGIAQGVFE